MGGIAALVNVATGANRKAANAQADAANNATNVEWQMYNQTREDEAPWRAAGARAVSTLENKINAGPGDFEASPGYQFRLNEGVRALDSGAAAKHTLFSGAAAKELQDYGQGMASNEYQNWLNNYYQSLTPYQSLAGLGQTATASTNAAGSNAANAISANQLYAGNAAASRYINDANAITGANKAMQSGLNNYLSWRYLNNTPTTTPQQSYGYGGGEGGTYGYGS